MSPQSYSRLTTGNVWKRVTYLSATVDLSLGSTWAAGELGVLQRRNGSNGRVEAMAYAPGIPTIETQEKRDRVGAGVYAGLVETGTLRIADGLRVQTPAQLVDAILAKWGKPRFIICDRFKLAELRDCARGIRLIERVSRWSESTEDIGALRKFASDGPLSCDPESRALIAASLSVAMVKNDDAGNVRLVKRGTNNTARDDVAAALVLRGGRSLNDGARKRPEYIGGSRNELAQRGSDNRSRWRAVRLKALDRDNWQCVTCGRKVDWRLTISRRWNPAGNRMTLPTVQTLCRPCHFDKTRSERPLRTVTPEQRAWKDFINERLSDSVINGLIHKGGFTLTALQRLQIRASEIRARLASIGSMPDMTDETRSELSTLSLEYTDNESKQTALTIAGDSPPTPTDSDTSEGRAFSELVTRASVGEIYDSAINHRVPDGATAEIQTHYGLDGNQVPLALMVRDWDEQLETRAVTPAPGQVAQNQASIIPWVFPDSAATFMGVSMPTVGVGEAVYPVLTKELDVRTPAENADANETTGSFSANVLSPARIQAAFFYSREDRARFAGMDEALRENLNAGLARRSGQADNRWEPTGC